MQTRLSVSPPGERRKVQGLLTGEEKEVGLLEKTLHIAEALRQISGEINAGGTSREEILPLRYAWPNSKETG